MQEIVRNCLHSEIFFFKYISANDAGATGGHQSGLYMPKNVRPMFYMRDGTKGENYTADIPLRWSNGRIQNASFKWYGSKTRAEYRLTRGFNFLTSEQTGDLIIFVKTKTGEYLVYLVSGDERIESFLEGTGLSPADSCRLISAKTQIQSKYRAFVDSWISFYKNDFPPAGVLSEKAREAHLLFLSDSGHKKADDLIIEWMDIEFELFRYIENIQYKEYLATQFESVDAIIALASTILNRRKSRAGFSFENHLAHLFRLHSLSFTSQALTEGSKKADFIFPSIEDYHNKNFESSGLTFLGVKTTCKDRWRQILNEADRIPEKYLLTLQQGISDNQIAEMHEAKVVLVVPQRYHSSFSIYARKKIITIDDFIHTIRNKSISGNSLFS